MPDRASYRIAQVTPYPWESGHEVNTIVSRLTEELSARGHQTLILAPSHSTTLVRDSRRLIRGAQSNPEQLFDHAGALAVGELLPIGQNRRTVAPAPPLDIARTIEDVLTSVPFDFVHVHEPFAPSASSVALRHSRALNVGSFYSPNERLLSAQGVRRFIELFFGRLDARTAAFGVTRDSLERSFGGQYQIVTPGTDAPESRVADVSQTVRIAFIDQEERAALRVFMRALRRLKNDVAYSATIYTRGTPAPPLRGELAMRTQIVDANDQTNSQLLANADIVVGASLGARSTPSLLLQAIRAGVVPVATRLAVYEEVVSDGELGLLFEPGDSLTLAAQLKRLIEDRQLRDRFVAAAQPTRERLTWSRMTDEFEAIFQSVAKRRHSWTTAPKIERQLSKRQLIDVDLHMHTDHSHDCATPVEVLLAQAHEEGLGAIAITDHNEVSGALDAQAKAADFGVKVIVAEEIKTARQGEVIGLFLKEKIARGLSLEETIAAIRAQDGLVYIPHPFDRLHSVPDYENLLSIVEEIDALEIFNPRVAISAFNEEAVRFARKYRIVAGAGSDAHVAQALGTVRIRMRDFDGPQEFLASLRDADIIRKPSSLLYVQALKFLQTKATPKAAQRATRARKVRKAVAGRTRPDTRK